MTPKPIWGAISSYFYPEEPVEGRLSPISPGPSTGDQVDEDGWMLVGPKRAPTPDQDEVGSIILVSNDSSDSDSDSNKRPCDNEVMPAADNGRVIKHMKQLSLIEQMMFEQNASSSSANATQPKNGWKSHNQAYAKGQQSRIRRSARNPGRRAC